MSTKEAGPGEAAPPGQTARTTKGDAYLAADAREARGKAARAVAPRASHAEFESASDRDPVAIVDEDTPSRVPELVPIRYGRMLVTPFTFYRGAASLMANDLTEIGRAHV